MVMIKQETRKKKLMTLVFEDRNARLPTLNECRWSPKSN